MNEIMSATFKVLLNLLDEMYDVFNGTESISFLGPKTCDIVPSELKQLVTVNASKREIKKRKPVNCPCRLCRPYIQNVGFS